MFVISSVQMHRLLFLLVCFITVLKLTNCESCLTQNPCECVLKNGSVIDISSLGYHNNKPRFENYKAVQKADNFSYFYNPCYGFKIGRGVCAEGVAVCQRGKDNDYNLGDSNNAKFHFEENNVLKLFYYGVSRITAVTLICSENAETPELTIKGEITTEHYEMTLKTKCACPDLCRTASHLSTGSVLVIIFTIFVSLYLLLGVVHSSLTRGAQGWELLPHHEFWADFPLLVRDGCVFVVNGCKADSTYDRI